MDAWVAAAGGVRGGYGATYSAAIAAGVAIAIDFLIILASGLLTASFMIENYGAQRQDYLTGATVAGGVVVSVFGYMRLYDFGALIRPTEQLRRVIPACTVAFLIMTLLAFSVSALHHYSVRWSYAFFLVGAIGLCLERYAAHYAILAAARLGYLTRNVIIVGGGPHGLLLVQSLLKQNSPWTRILGIFDDRAGRIQGSIEGYPVLGTTDDLIEFTRNVRVDDIFIALPWTAESRVLEILDVVRVVPANVHLSPDIVGHVFIEKKFTLFDGIPVLNVLTKPLDGWNNVIKWVEDKVLAILGTILLIPVFLVLAVAIKLDSPGPVLFRQKRLGFNNKLIEVYKFRSMHHDRRDENAERLATRDDPRVTRVGRFLRRSSLDEIPQVLNVLRGDMSIVGPRPHATRAKAAGKLYQDVVAEYAARHKIKPGITGWAQVNGWRGETDTEEKIRRRVECDLYYMENWSIFLDLYIILRTVIAVSSGKSAH